jgi:uncharacterized membrane protein HdeD (DUF308 family)
VRLRKLIETEWVLIFSGVVSIIFVILLIVFSSTVTLSLVWSIGAYAVIFDILTLMLAFRVLGIRDSLARQAVRPL